MKKKTYLVRDNSFQKCLNDNVNHLLSGDIFGSHPRQTVEIVVPPFQRSFTDNQNKIQTHLFIIGKCKKGLYHLILYTKPKK